MKFTLTYVMVLVLCGTLPAKSQEADNSLKYLNLNFDSRIPGSSTISNWTFNTNNYMAMADSIVKTSGSNSLRISSSNSQAKNTATFLQVLPAGLFKDKKIKISGFIKTDDLVNGYAGLWCRADAPDGTFTLENMSNQHPSGTTNWQQYSIELYVKPNTQSLYFGGLHNGKGTAWFDDLKIFIDGREYIDTPPVIKLASQKELDWLRSAIIPLSSYQPGSNNADLKPLLKAIGNARVVALGESTHGNSAIYQMKHRIIQYLNQEAGFKTFAIEANMPESYKLNTYIREGQGKAADLVHGMQVWPWNSKEMLDMVNWMKEANNTQHAGISFTGFDMQSFNAPLIEVASALLDIDQKAMFPLLTELEKQLKAIETQRKSRGARSLSAEQKAYFADTWPSLMSFANGRISNQQQQKWVLQNIRLLQQYTSMEGPDLRDKFMAENLLWIKKQDPEKKIVLWAHNGHVKKTNGRMGNFLADTLKNQYLSIGFAFHNGSYTAMGKSGLTAYPAQASYPGTYESYFQALSQPVFALDLRNLPKNKAADWLRNPLLFRSVGAVKIENEFSKTDLTKDFDILIFIDTSVPSVMLGK